MEKAEWIKVAVSILVIAAAGAHYIHGMGDQRIDRDNLRIDVTGQGNIIILHMREEGAQDVTATSPHS